MLQDSIFPLFVLLQGTGVSCVCTRFESRCGPMPDGFSLLACFASNVRIFSESTRRIRFAIGGGVNVGLGESVELHFICARHSARDAPYHHDPGIRGTVGLFGKRKLRPICRAYLVEYSNESSVIKARSVLNREADHRLEFPLLILSLRFSWPPSLAAFYQKQKAVCDHCLYLISILASL